MAKFRILLIADSRARKFQQEICLQLRNKGVKDIYFHVLYNPGATIAKAVTKSLLKIATHPKYDIIYLLAGVNNLTTLLSPRNTVPNFECKDQVVNHLLAEYQLARLHLLEKSTCVIICELVGLCMATYNTKGEPFWEEQTEIDNAMPTVNEGLAAINGHNFFTPRYGEHVHATRHGRYGSRYKGTMSDGLHFNNKTIIKYATYLIATFYHNLHELCN